jgi:tetratricopeptide (TPR) repeat protein
MKWASLFPDRAAALAGAVIVATVVLTYSNSLDCPFLFDDKSSILTNLSLHRWEQVWPVILEGPGKGTTVQGRPVLNASLALNYAACGTDVWGYHATNVAIHALAALVLFGLVRLTLRLPAVPAALSARATGVALAVALVWGAHPLQTESVTYTVQRAESLSGLWYLLTLYTFARGATAARPGPWYAAAVACCALGMGTKEVVVSAPLAVLLYDRAFLSRSPGAALRARPRLYLGLSATWVLLAVLVVGSGGRSGTAGYGTEVSVWEYARSQPVFILRYRRLTVWPDPLVLDYGVELVTDPWEYVPAALAVAALAGLAVWAVVRRPRTGLLVFLFFALLAPTSSVVPVGTQTAAEHRMYLPLAPLVVLAVVGSVGAADRLARRRGARVALSGWVLVAVLLAALAHARNNDYRTERGMWEDVAAKRPDNDRAHANIAYCADTSNEPEVAEREYRTAVRLVPSCANWHKLVGFLHRHGRDEEARQACDEAVKVDYAGDGYRLRASFRADRGDLDGALRDADEALARGQPTAGDNSQVQIHALTEGYKTRAQVHLRAGRHSQAIADFTRAIECDPTQPDPYFKRGQLRGAYGDRAGAGADFTEALRLDPDEPNYYASRALNYYALGKRDLAFADLDAAIQLSPRPLFLHLRGDLRRQQGRVDEALADLNQALEGDPDARDVYRTRALCHIAKGRTGPARADLLRYQQLGGQLDGQLREFLTRTGP